MRQVVVHIVAGTVVTAATVTVTPMAAAAVKTCSIWFMPCAVQVLSALPQLIDTTEGRRVVSGPPLRLRR